MIKNTSFTKELWESPVRRAALLTSATCILLQAAIPAWRILPLVQGREAVPLHYNVLIGVDWIGAWWFIFTPAATGLLFLLINIIAMRLVFKKEEQLATLVSVQTVVTELLLLLAAIFVVLLNISYG